MRNQASTAAQPSAETLAATATDHDYGFVSDSDVAMLCRLATLVNETGSDVITRMILRIAKGNGRAYRAELNRLTAKFIASLERHYSACP